jgi:hypothetical protein
MRRLDKRLNIQKANLLTEQRYMEDKTGIIEGPTTDIAGVTDALLDLYKSAAQGAQSVDFIDSKVYYLVKKTLEGHQADPETRKNMYLTLANKVDALAQTVQDPNVQAELETKAKSWRVMASQADVKVGNTADLMRHLGQHGLK